MGRGNGDSTLFFLRSLVNIAEISEFSLALGGKYTSYSRRQGRLPIIDMANRANIDMRLPPLKFLLCHNRVSKDNELYIEAA
jgi:hypothetical protein